VEYDAAFLMHLSADFRRFGFWFFNGEAAIPAPVL